MTNFIGDIISLVGDAIMADSDTDQEVRTDKEAQSDEEMSDTDTSEIICKYCLQTTKELKGAALLLPCRCTTPVCHICLQQRLEFFAKKRNIVGCEICMASFDEDIVGNLFESGSIVTRLAQNNEIENDRTDTTESERSDDNQSDDNQAENDRTNTTESDPSDDE